MGDLPKNFEKIQARYGAVIESLQNLGQAAGRAGPVDRKTAHLIQLAAAAALRSEGAVHSHAKRALASGASADEIRQALILLTPTIGFPTVAAALCWADDILGDD